MEDFLKDVFLTENIGFNSWGSVKTAGNTHRLFAFVVRGNLSDDIPDVLKHIMTHVAYITNDIRFIEAYSPVLMLNMSNLSSDGVIDFNNAVWNKTSLESPLRKLTSDVTTSGERAVNELLAWLKIYNFMGSTCRIPAYDTNSIDFSREHEEHLYSDIFRSLDTLTNTKYFTTATQKLLDSQVAVICCKNSNRYPFAPLLRDISATSIWRTFELSPVDQDADEWLLLVGVRETIDDEII